MANTYSQISIHAVFAVKSRGNFITHEWRDNLHKYLSGIITGNGAKSLAVGGWKDHVHVFLGMPVTTCISDLMSIVKASSSKWINEQRFIKGKFQWQAGYGAFSYSRSQRDKVINYIMTQEEHHRIKTFQEEYLKMLSEFEVEYEKKNIFLNFLINAFRKMSPRWGFLPCRQLHAIIVTAILALSAIEGLI